MKSMTWNRITSLAIAAAASLSAVVYAVPQDGTCPDPRHKEHR